MTSVHTICRISNWFGTLISMVYIIGYILLTFDSWLTALTEIRFPEFFFSLIVKEYIAQKVMLKLLLMFTSAKTCWSF